MKIGAVKAFVYLRAWKKFRP